MCNCDPKQNCTCGTEQPLVAAIEENWSESYAAYAGAPQVELDASPEFTSVITGIPSPWYNGVFQSRLDTGELERQIDGIIAQYKKRGIPLSWWSGCSSGPDNLHNALEAHGLKQVVELPEMAIDLDRLPADNPLPAGLTIERVHESRGFQEWLEAYTVGMGTNPQISQAAGDLYRRLGLGDERPWHYYLGRLDGKPVATTALFLGSRVAGIYSVATVPEARGKGIARAMMLHTLDAARAANYDVAILQASEMGLPVYKKLGFQEYCSLRGYVLE